jgi:hypothetical protein
MFAPVHFVWSAMASSFATMGSPLMTGMVEHVPAVGMPGGMAASPADAPPPSPPGAEPLLPPEVLPLPPPEDAPLLPEDGPAPLEDVPAPLLLVSEPLLDDVPPLEDEPLPEPDAPPELEPLLDDGGKIPPESELEPHDAVRTNAAVAARPAGRIARTRMASVISTKRTDVAIAAICTVFPEIFDGIQTNARNGRAKIGDASDEAGARSKHGEARGT